VAYILGEEAEVVSNFTQFLRSKKAEEQAEGENLQRRKSEWLRSLEKLFSKIEEWLSEPVSQDLIKLGRETVALDEYKLGTYNAPRLVLQVGHETVYVEPVGSIIIGAKGRVDVKRGGTSFKLILTHEDKWGILEPDRTVAEQLDESTFTKALQDLLS
jgi:hypothetical protein